MSTVTIAWMLVIAGALLGTAVIISAGLDFQNIILLAFANSLLTRGFFYLFTLHPKVTVLQHCTYYVTPLGDLIRKVCTP